MGCKAEDLPAVFQVTCRILRESTTFITEMSLWCCQRRRVPRAGGGWQARQEPLPHGCSHRALLFPLSVVLTGSFSSKKGGSSVLWVGTETDRASQVLSCAGLS